VRFPTTLELIRDHGVHAGADRVCCCCKKALLFSIRYSDGTVVLLCSNCDTDQQ